MSTSVPPTVFVVTNGNGGEVDSVWGEQNDAQAQADMLNGQAHGMTLGWSVTSAPYRC